MIAKWFTVASVIVIALGTTQFRAILANGNSSTSGDEKEVKENKNLFLAWIERPPYTTSPSDESLDNDVHGLIRDALYQSVFYDCSYASGWKYIPKTNRVDSEFRMIDLLSQNRVHLAAPVFEPINRRYITFPFVKLVDYPGTDFITTEDETKGINVVLDAVLKSWPLFVVTLILTAIAGVIMWALVSFVWNASWRLEDAHAYFYIYMRWLGRLYVPFQSSCLFPYMSDTWFVRKGLYGPQGR